MFTLPLSEVGKNNFIFLHVFKLLLRFIYIMEENRLLKLMVAHHGLIEALLVVFKDSLNDPQKAQESFDDFKWQTEKHFFVEEKVNFRFVLVDQEELYKIVQRLTDEHSQMLGMLGRLEDQLKKGEQVEMDALVDMLTKHREVEEKVLYPKMDELLGEYQKNLITKRINEIVIEK
ncbi:MAG: hemerythrin domain-containing protein [Candidatus Marinimicrobia bacterium]|nr:hemerythrin domain-containing protein [Candidatus Neomarinimicrobiota bacterium]